MVFAQSGKNKIITGSDPIWKNPLTFFPGPFVFLGDFLATGTLLISDTLTGSLLTEDTLTGALAIEDTLSGTLTFETPEEPI